MKNLRLRVLPYPKDQRIDKLTQAVLAEWKVAIAKENIALQTKQNAYKSFCSMLNYAVKMEFIPKNNLSVLGNFKDTAVFEKPSEKIHYYTAEQFERFISVVKSERKTVIDWGLFRVFQHRIFNGRAQRRNKRSQMVRCRREYTPHSPKHNTEAERRRC